MVCASLLSKATRPGDQLENQPTGHGSSSGHLHSRRANGKNAGLENQAGVPTSMIQERLIA
jgi:hypothetical protein